MPKLRLCGEVTDGYERFFGGKTYKNVPVPLDAIPVSIEAALSCRVSSVTEARGELYMDDERSLAAELEGEGTVVTFHQTKEGLRSTATAATPQGKRYTSLKRVGRFKVHGFQSKANLPSFAAWRQRR
ncbi:hypothetical protein L917_07307 [Phytophthora nicotianae]|uniref:Uncharacterized protein n=1 Tax=Phytophthora nicotianae TaxID=4792 RepID=W2LDS5_PHYNI|nr:hypothetical protein L917_07307 [Phytophthora nicotianae]